MTSDLVRQKLMASIARARQEGFTATAEAMVKILNGLSDPKMMSPTSKKRLPNDQQQA